MEIKLLGSLFFLYLLFIEPWLRMTSRKKSLASYKTNPNALTDMYKGDCYRNIILGVMVLLIAGVTATPLSQLGFREINFSDFINYPLILKSSILLFFAWFFCYFYLFATFGVRLIKSARPYLIRKIAPVAFNAPSTYRERKWWVIHSFVSAAEELAYRGFIFFFLPLMFPKIYFSLVILIAISLEAIRYIPRFAAIRYVFIRGAIFTLGFAISHSLIVAIILHVSYNLRMLAVPFHWARELKRPDSSIATAIPNNENS